MGETAQSVKIKKFLIADQFPKITNFVLPILILKKNGLFLKMNCLFLIVQHIATKKCGGFVKKDIRGKKVLASAQDAMTDAPTVQIIEF